MIASCDADKSMSIGKKQFRFVSNGIKAEKSRAKLIVYPSDCSGACMIIILVHVCMHIEIHVFPDLIPENMVGVKVRTRTPSPP